MIFMLLYVIFVIYVIRFDNYVIDKRILNNYYKKSFIFFGLLDEDLCIILFLKYLMLIMLVV